MTRQLDIFAEPVPHNGTPTSIAAADSMRDHVARLEGVVLAAVRFAGERGLTCDEVEIRTGLGHQCASARLNGLAHKQLIVPTGEKRATRSGRGAVCWRAA